MVKDAVFLFPQFMLNFKWKKRKNEAKSYPLFALDKNLKMRYNYSIQDKEEIMAKVSQFHIESPFTIKLKKTNEKIRKAERS